MCGVDSLPMCIHEVGGGGLGYCMCVVCVCAGVVVHACLLFCAAKKTAALTCNDSERKKTSHSLFFCVLYIYFDCLQ